MKQILILLVIQFLFSRSLDVQFYSENDWLYGRSWSEGITFYNSIGYGSGMVGESTMSENYIIDIDIHFSLDHDSVSIAPVYSVIGNSYLGNGTFPGIVLDVSDPENPRQLNVAFFEQENGNLFWDPDDILYGNYEYLLIMNSDYDSTGTLYDDYPAYNEDTQYFCWLRLRPGQEWFSSTPATLEFRNYWDFSDFYLQSDNTEIQLFWEHENPEIEQLEIDSYLIFKGQLGDPIEQIAEVNSNIHTFIDNNVSNGETYNYYISGVNGYGETIIETDQISGTPNINVLNVDFIANWNGGHDASDVNGVSVYNDIWGYTSENGIEYALIGGFDGTYIVDVSTNPEEPELVSFIQGSYSSHRDIKTYGHFMYAGTEANRADPVIFTETGESYELPQGVQVVDISDPENAELVYEWDGVVQSHNIMEADGYLYVIGSNQYNSQDGEQQSWGLDDLIILDLESNPAEPVKVGGWSSEYLHDVCVMDNILYGCGIYSGSMIAFDISDKSNPEVITQWYGIQSAHSCWVSDDGNTLFTGSETTGGHIMSWDVSDLGNVEYLDEWMPPGGNQFSAHNVFVKDQYLYMSYYLYGLQVIDISDPANLTHVGAYDTYLQNSGYIYNGAWGVYPYLPSGKILISDRQTGLYVLDFMEENLSSVPNIQTMNEFKIINSYPNPANPNVIINFNIGEIGIVSAEIIDIKGQQLSSIFLGNLSPGKYSESFNFSSYSSGVYWIRLTQYNNEKLKESNSIPVTILK